MRAGGLRGWTRAAPLDRGRNYPPFKNVVDSDDCEDMSERDDEDAAMSSTECDTDTELADGESTPRVMASTPPGSVATLESQFGMCAQLMDVRFVAEHSVSIDAQCTI